LEEHNALSAYQERQRRATEPKADEDEEDR
jgi:hypothetical protein